jgi:DNA-binding transcriptional ArsR family regulator
MALPQPLPPELVELIAHRFKLLSEPMRVRILDRLRDGERSVGELVDELGTTQQNVSKHLSTLHRERVVGRRSEGNRVLYRITDETVLALCEYGCGGLERAQPFREPDVQVSNPN